MKVYRIAKKNFAKDLTGEGARLYGGRWNFIGDTMLYTASNVALAALEVVVNMQFVNIPSDYKIVVIEIPDILKVYSMEMDADINWTKNITISQYFGQQWLNSKVSLLAEVSSVIVPIDKNILINPLHPDFSKVKIIDVQDFNFDKRLIK
ncbi:MAG: RES domain-containing protein [Cytophagales bacterium]|nr:MAG: RES domain-containing protein [Cytophagales bacterium]